MRDGFQLRIETTSAAFGETDDEQRAEVARILRVAADRLEAPTGPGVCYDINGNRVGQFHFLGPEDDLPDREIPLAVRHDMYGYYILNEEEAEHEDAGNPSVGFDGRQHYATLAEAIDAARD